MLKALELTPEPARLLLAGLFDPPEYRTILQGLGVHDRVSYLGWLDRSRISDLLFTSHVGLVIHRYTPSMEWKLPTKLFEYMAAGMPFVATGLPHYRPIVERYDCGIIVNPDPLDPKEIAEAVSFLLQDLDRAREMGRNGRSAVEREFRWDTEASALVDAYRKVFCSRSESRSGEKE
jgi:glycosyltransferase involved in cell wall biosynthesis